MELSDRIATASAEYESDSIRQHLAASARVLRGSEALLGAGDTEPDISGLSCISTGPGLRPRDGNPVDLQGLDSEPSKGLQGLEESPDIGLELALLNQTADGVRAQLSDEGHLETGVPSLRHSRHAMSDRPVERAVDRASTLEDSAGSLQGCGQSADEDIFVNENTVSATNRR